MSDDDLTPTEVATTPTAGADPTPAEAQPVVAPAAEQAAEAALEEPATEPTPAEAQPVVAPAAEQAAEAALEEPATAPTPAEAQPVVAPAAEQAAEAALEEPATEPATAEPASDEPVVPTAPAVEEPAEATAAAVPAPRPTPRPVPRPVPRPSARPVAVTPAAISTSVAGPAAGAAIIQPDLSPAEAAEAATWGRVEEDGTIWLREAGGERVVGQIPGTAADEALAFYVRRYADLHAKVALAEARLTTDVAPKELEATVASLTEELAEPAVVGDLDALRVRLTAIAEATAERRAAADAERAAAKAVALEARTALVEAAEKIAATEPEKIQWRPAGEQLRELLDAWKEAQRTGPRIDRPSEDALWKRFSHARSTFDRERRRYFAELEKVGSAAKAAKSELVAKAEALASSTEWGPTSGAFRDLMAQWKLAGRASRKDDDALWEKFRSAQDRFFAARDAAAQQTDAEYGANLEVKETLLVEAEALVPVTDLAAAKRTLRSIQERWEDAGKVPRGAIQRVEGRLRAVEQAVRDVEQAQWSRSNPETKARAEGALAQLTSAIAQLEADLARATAAKDTRRIAEAQAALDARRAWLEQIEKAAADSR